MIAKKELEADAVYSTELRVVHGFDWMLSAEEKGAFGEIVADSVQRTLKIALKASNFSAGLRLVQLLESGRVVVLQFVTLIQYFEMVLARPCLSTVTEPTQHGMSSTGGGSLRAESRGDTRTQVPGARLLWSRLGFQETTPDPLAER